jgi:N-hydroxyarylamine O-acetyltransferase
MTLRVDLDGTRLLADVGFGADGLLLPVPLDGTVSEQFVWTYRVVDDGDAQLLKSLCGDRWEDLYAFTHEPQLPVDYEIANHYTSTHPASRFTQMLTAQAIAPDVRRILRDRDYAEDRGTSSSTRTIGDDDELVALLAQAFGLEFPAGTRFVRGRGARDG